MKNTRMKEALRDEKLSDLNESKKTDRGSLKESKNTYIEESEAWHAPSEAAENIVYSVYSTLKAFRTVRLDVTDNLRNLYEDISDLREKSEVAAYEDFKSIASDLRDVANILKDNDYDEEAEALRYAATLLAGRFDESKKTNRKNLKESTDLANLIAEVKDIRDEARYREDQVFLDLADDLDAWISEADSNGLNRETVSDLYKVIEYYNETNAAGLNKDLRDICRKFIRALDESNKRKVIGKVSMKEAKKALKEDEDEDYGLLLDALTKNLDSADIEYSRFEDKLYYISNADKIKEIAQRVCDEFNNYAKPVFSDPSAKKFYQYVTFTDNDEPEVGEGSDGLTDQQKSIIEEMADADYEIGHPLDPDEAVGWFRYGKEEGIPADLAQEAADYYFEVFDQIREDDNSDFDEE